MVSSRSRSCLVARCNYIYMNFHMRTCSHVHTYICIHDLPHPYTYARGSTHLAGQPLYLLLSPIRLFNRLFDLIPPSPRLRLQSLDLFMSPTV